MKRYSVSFEIYVDADSALNAAKKVNDLMTNKSNESERQFYVQAEDSFKIYSVDLAEDDNDAVLLVTDYTPCIIN